MRMTRGRKKVLVIAAVFAVLIVAILVPPGRARAPAPKGTITGLLDQVTSPGRNRYDGDNTRTGDHEWYTRTRFHSDFVFDQ